LAANESPAIISQHGREVNGAPGRQQQQQQQQ
jgi:hypothetical protein